jgi:hypothetical protein
MNYATIVLFSAAITVVFTRGTIFNALRTHGPDLWRELVTCSLCSGVWVGAGVTWLAARYLGFRTDFPLLFTMLGLGSLVGCVAMLFVRVVDWLEARAYHEEKQLTLFLRLIRGELHDHLRVLRERAQIRAERAEAAKNG